MTEKDFETGSVNPSGGAGNSTPVALARAQSGQTSPLPQPGSVQDAEIEPLHESSIPGAGIAVREAGTAKAGADQGNAKDLKAPVSDPGRTPFRPSWTIITVACALLLTLLSVAGIILVTRPRATIDQVLILTVPSGADVTFDGKNLGPSPVKLEGVRMGTHRIRVTKEGYQDADYDESIADSRTLDYKLKLMLPPGAEGLTEEQQVSQYKQNMEEAFSRGDYAVPYYRSALYFVQLILERDALNPSALEMKDRVLKAMVQAAHAAMSRIDLAQAQELVNALNQYFPGEDEARAAAAKLEAQIAIHRSDVRELIRKAEDALRAGNLIDPPRASAFYYTKQALTLDRQNQRAKAIKAQVHDEVIQSIDRTATSGNLVQATRELEQALKLFPEDSQLQAKQKDLDQLRAAEAKANDPKDRRLRGLNNYTDGNYEDAIKDLEFAFQHDRAGPEVVSALGMSFKKLRQFDKAIYYLGQVHQSSDPSSISAIAALGECEAELGNTGAAIEKYKQARDLGGSAMYTPSELEARIDKLEKKQAGKLVVEPTPLTIQVKHIHGGILHGSCAGTLVINGAGVRYDGNDGNHVFASNLMHAGVRLSKKDMIVTFYDKHERFEAIHSGDADRFREALSRYQSAQTSAQ
jgi:hypothetical protein